MEKERITIQAIATADILDINYSDDDIVIVENVKKLVEPRPTRLNLTLILVCTNGRAQANLNGERVVFHKNQVVISPPNIALTDIMLSPDFDFKAMFLTNRIVQSFVREKMNIWNEALYLHKMYVWSLNENDNVFYNHFFELLKQCIENDKDNPFHTEIVQSLLHTSFLALCGRFKMNMPLESQTNERTPTNNLMQRFLMLIGNSKIKHRTVESYASELCITPKYLSAICKRQSGKTANEWITESVLEEIRYNLKHTDMSIKQISVQLGFPNTSFFGKYVKEHFGMTPTQLRNSR